MPDIMVNGVRLFYGERGSGTAMVWAHGLGGTWQEWEGLIEFFRDRYRVIAYDARGHGDSEKPDRPEAYSQDIMVEDMRGVMDALDINKVIVGGHSMGANVALNFALRYPERCIGLIPVGIGSGSSGREWWKEWWGHMADTAEKEGIGAYVEEMKKLPAWGVAFADPKLGKPLIQAELANSPEAIAAVIRGVQKERPNIFELAPKLEKLPVKTLVMMSEGDAPVVECSRFMIEHIPQGTLGVIPAKSHWTHLEAPERFLEAVNQFVRRLKED
ncbi:3-oxoadipate enol-lactonase 2 [subsurface metagenome]|nr:alpha/beta fold hydrolase [Dehalococcoidia bacterium]